MSTEELLPIETRKLVGWSRTTPITGHVLSTPYPEVIAEAVARREKRKEAV